mmetsp:Transcript_6041/g.20681  ORF Transcript_6041/g.20681 Transcript_6041/m.20681 type:complete len:333 (+) Transcript_6041:1327-2325(+)
MERYAGVLVVVARLGGRQHIEFQLPFLQVVLIYLLVSAGCSKLIGGEFNLELHGLLLPVGLLFRHCAPRPVDAAVRLLARVFTLVEHIPSASIPCPRLGVFEEPVGGALVVHVPRVVLKLLLVVWPVVVFIQTRAPAVIPFLGILGAGAVAVAHAVARARAVGQVRVARALALASGDVFRMLRPKHRDAGGANDQPPRVVLLALHRVLQDVERVGHITESRLGRIGVVAVLVRMPHQGLFPVGTLQGLLEPAFHRVLLLALLGNSRPLDAHELVQVHVLSRRLLICQAVFQVSVPPLLGGVVAVGFADVPSSNLPVSEEVPSPRPVDIGPVQ